jgi:hypothetical protein
VTMLVRSLLLPRCDGSRGRGKNCRSKEPKSIRYRKRKTRANNNDDHTDCVTHAPQEALVT